MKFTIDIDDSKVPMSDGDAAAAGAWLDMTLRDNGYTVGNITWTPKQPASPQWKLIIKPRQAGKSEDVLTLAAEHFAYIVCPTMQDVTRLWRRAGERGLHMPQPITWREFLDSRYRGRGIKAFIIDDLDRCVQSMTTVEIKAASLTGGARTEKMGAAGKRAGTAFREGLTTNEVYRYVAANRGVRLLDMIQAYQRDGVDREVIASTMIDMLGTGVLNVDFLGRVTLPGLSAE